MSYYLTPLNPLTPMSPIDPLDDVVVIDSTDAHQIVQFTLDPDNPAHAGLIEMIQNKTLDGVGHGCEAVRQLQQLLSHRYNVAVDGQFGPGTEAAVRQFQADNGLVVDGLVGPATWALLVESQYWDF